MKNILFIVFLTNCSILHAQNLRPKSIYASYFGETITHPGLKIGVTYQLKQWDKTKLKKNGKKRNIQKNIDLSPGIGFFYHKDYQTALFILPELSYSRKNVKGNFITAGFGAGYMRTFIPHVYDLNSNGEIVRIVAGYNYFLTDLSLTFGKDLSVKKKLPICLFFKPQLMYALPNATKGVSYFVFEIGASYKFTKNKSKETKF